MREFKGNLVRQGMHVPLYGTAEDGEVVVRARNGEDRSPEDPVVARIGWKYHVDRPAEPLHDSILEHIAGRLAAIASEAHEQGYKRAQEDFQRVLGLRVW